MNFEILGHSYFPGPHLASGSFGAGFNTPRVYKGIAYLAGYPPTLFGVIIADVKDPANMKQLAFIPNNPGTRTAYLRLNAQKNILVIGYDANAANPIQVPAGQSVKGGWVFYDVKDPANPVKLGEFVNPGAATHGFEIDDRYVYGCASTTQTKKPVGTAQSLSVVDYSDPKSPTLASVFHITGQFDGETYASDDVKNPDGTPQIIQCHEVNKDGTRLWVAWRDAGILSLDASDPKNVKQLGRYDYVPPYNGGSLGAAHTAAVSPHASGNASILLTNDEIFACPAGLDRVVDVTDPAHMTVLSTIRIPEVDDKYDAASGKFVCPPGQQSAHQPYFPPYGNGSLVFQAWYGQGMRAWDISNPYQPKEVGRFISPQYLRAPQQRREDGHRHEGCSHDSLPSVRRRCVRPVSLTRPSPGREGRLQRARPLDVRCDALCGDQAAKRRRIRKWSGGARRSPPAFTAVAPGGILTRGDGWA